MYKIYYNEVYNKNVKNEFLTRYKDNTATTYRRIFHKVSQMEDYFGKDLCNFNLDEIEWVMIDLTPITPAASQSLFSVLLTYVDWAMENGYSNNSINPLRAVNTKWVTQFADKYAKLYITGTELIEIEEMCANYQDAVIFRLLFEGVGGETWSEIRNLTGDDIDVKNKTLYLRDKDNNTRVLEVSTRCIRYCQEALDEKEYFKKNGLMEEHVRIKNIAELVQNNYVVRNAITKTHTFSDPVADSTIYRRVHAIRDFYGVEYLTPKNVLISGVLYQAKMILEKQGTEGLLPLHYEEIANKFNIKTSTAKRYVTKENLKKLYNSI